MREDVSPAPTSHQKTSGKTLFGFSLAGSKFNSKSKTLSVNIDSPGSVSPQGGNSASSSMATGIEIDTPCSSSSYLDASFGQKSPGGGGGKSPNISKIGSYEIDLEQLAKELILPSLNAPLTSFKSPNELAAPPNAGQQQQKATMHMSKTLETSTPGATKKILARSLTQNK